MTTIYSSSLSLTIQPDSNAGNLLISRHDLPGNIFDFRTCEGVLEKNKDFGLFKMMLKESDWSIDGNTLGYKWIYPSGVQVEFSCFLNNDQLDLEYTVVNNTEGPLERVQIHPCIPTTNAPAFFPMRDIHPPDCKPSYFDRRGPAMVPCKGETFSELLERTCVYTNGLRLPLKETSGGKSEYHLSIMRAGETPVEWAWWNNVNETFQDPVITVESKDRNYSLLLWFESTIWASSNVGDERACFHLFPFFGAIAKNGTSKVRGKLLIIDGTATKALERIGSLVRT